MSHSHLGKVALLIDERQDVERFDSQQVQGGLVVGEDDAFPGDVLQVVLLLLLLEHVLHEELLQLLISKVDAQLLKTARGTWEDGGRELKMAALILGSHYMRTSYCSS